MDNSQAGHNTSERSLFGPCTIGGLHLANRIVMAPMTRTRAQEHGVPTALMNEYYTQRASAGLIVTECTQISEQGRGIIRAPAIETPDQIEGWKAITHSVHASGGHIFLQLWHCGRVSHPAIRFDKSMPVAPSALAASGQIFTPEGRLEYPTPLELTIAQINNIVADFGSAARNAKAAGFDGVELHGAFGYLPDQFLQDGSNKRTDGYGGSIANRARFMIESVEALSEVWGSGRVGVKLSPSNRVNGMMDSNARDTFGYVISTLNAMNVGYLHLMEPSQSDLKTGTVQIERVAETFRPLITVALIANGGFDKTKAQAAIETGTAELVSFGQLFVANPDLPARFKHDGPFNKPDPATFYGEGPKGYTDYPALSAGSTN
jgi:N-ethylmaleimide reductase